MHGNSFFNLFKNPEGLGILNIAHRGASAYYPENTMAAFRGALEMGADMIEFDVQLSKDGVPVAFHDVSLDLRTDGMGKITDLTLKDLKKLDAGSWFNPDFAGLRIPTLEEVVDFAKGRIGLNAEIKAYPAANPVKIAEACYNVAEQFRMENQILFSSFDEASLVRIKKIDVQAQTGLLYSGAFPSIKKLIRLIRRCRADTFHCTNRQIIRRLFPDLKAHGIPVYVYTVDRPERMKRLINLGVKGIFTNKPDVLSGVKERLNQDRHDPADKQDV